MILDQYMVRTSCACGAELSALVDKQVHFTLLDQYVQSVASILYESKKSTRSLIILRVLDYSL